MKLSIIVPSLEGNVPESLVRAIGARGLKARTSGGVEGSELKANGQDEVEIVVVKGVRPVGKARNEGLRRARGEYVAWVDADDEVSEEWLETILEAIDLKGRSSGGREVGAGRERSSAARASQLDEEGCAVGREDEGQEADVVTFDAELVGWEYAKESRWGEKKPTIEKLRRDVMRDLARPSALWLYATRRELWEGIEFDESVRIAEDYLVLPRVLERAKSVKYIPKKLYRYQHSEGSLIDSRVRENDLAMMEIRKRRIEEAPRKLKGAAYLAAATGAYWTWNNFLHRDDREVRNAAKKAMKAAIIGAMKELVFGSGLSLKERIKWSVKFALCLST